MYIIKMEQDKTLTPTVRVPIYMGERNADTLVFLLPQTYNGCGIKNCEVVLKYILPGANGHMETLSLLDEDYKGFLKYGLPIDSKLTSHAGEVRVWLTLYHGDNMILKTSVVILLVQESPDVTEYLPEEEKAGIDDLYARVAHLESSKADNLCYDRDGAYMQLLAGGKPIGDAADLSGLGGGDGTGGGDYNDLKNLPVKNLDAAASPVVVSTLQSGVYRISGTWRMTADDHPRSAAPSDLYYVYNHDNAVRVTRVGAESISEYACGPEGGVTENYYLTESDIAENLWSTF